MLSVVYAECRGVFLMLHCPPRGILLEPGRVLRGSCCFDLFAIHKTHSKKQPKAHTPLKIAQLPF
jgi:hypothetical protein